MNWRICLVGLLLWAGFAQAKEVHTWTDLRGRQVKAAFVKRDGASVFLELEDGKTISTKLENLCKADQAYVEEVSYVQAEVVVQLKRRNGFGEACELAGASPAATIRDTVMFQVLEEPAGPAAAPVGDSRWKIESVNVLGKTLPPQKEGGAAKLESKGKFVLVSYEVRNLSKAAVRGIPPPILFDKDACPATQYERSGVNLRDYVPEGVLLAGEDVLRPGLPQTFWTYFEIPADAEPAMVEVFPLRASVDGALSPESKGKQIYLSPEAVKGLEAKLAAPAEAGEAPKKSEGEVEPATAAAAAAAPGPADKRVIVLLDARRTKQSGDTKSVYMKVRSLTYQVDVRLMSSNEKQVPAVIKVFFVGQTSDKRNVVVDRQEREVVLDQTKNWSEPFTSKEIREQRSYFYYYDYLNNARRTISGAELNGIIVQVWVGGSKVKSISKGDPSIKRYEDVPDVVKALGEMKDSEVAQ
jgi:hypothetical protein